MKTFQRLVLAALVLIALRPVAASAQDAPAAGEGVRNIIYMIGDGMGVAQVSQLIINHNLEKIEMERAAAVGLVRTFSANNRVTDSAVGGTALATGYKTNNGVLGIDPKGDTIPTVLEGARDRGMGTGIVVTSYVTHATPAAFYAHVDNRSDYRQIAAQLYNADIDVFIGGARSHFDKRDDGRNILEEFDAKGYRVAEEPHQYEAITEGKLAAVLTPSGHMPAMTEGRGDYLPTAVGKALEILTNNSAKSGTGFFLMVEGSQIDFTGHGNDSEYMIEEMRDFDKAVGVAFDYADRHPGTLVVVLADHETGGLSIPSGDEDFTAAESGVSYEFGTKSHTAALIPMFAYGTGAEYFSKVMDNTEMPKQLARLLSFEL